MLPCCGPLVDDTSDNSPRMDDSAPNAGYEPNAVVEFSSTKVTPFHRPSRRTGSVYTSGEDATTPVSSEVDERQAPEGWLHRCSCRREREASAVLARIYFLNGETSTSHSSHIPRKCRATCRNVHTQKQVESRDTFRQRMMQRTHTDIEQRHKKRTGDTSHK